MKKNTYSALEAYKNLHSYEKVELGWLTGKLTAYEIEELEKQIEYLILEAEEAAFTYAYEGTSNVIDWELEIYKKSSKFMLKVRRLSPYKNIKPIYRSASLFY